MLDVALPILRTRWQYTAGMCFLFFFMALNIHLYWPKTSVVEVERPVSFMPASVPTSEPAPMPVAIVPVEHQGVGAPEVKRPVNKKPAKKKAAAPVAKKPAPYRPRETANLSVIETPTPGADPDVEAYIARYYKLARVEMEKYGIPASITLAQGIIESNAGKSKLAKNNLNHFGVKCMSKRCPKGHCTNHTDDSHKDFFRKYTSVWASYRDHSVFLKNGSRYSKCFKYGKDYKKWARGLKAAGYATDSRYAETLISTIERYRLNRFDK